MLDELKNILPDHETELARLEQLVDENRSPVFAISGKSNHGKSTLVNALIGDYRFAEADLPETRKVAVQDAQDITWMDTPGLGVDLDARDDQLAKEAVAISADHVLLVHHAAQGELDREELAWFQEVAQSHTDRVTLVISAKDTAKPEELERILEVVGKQLPDVPVFCVSAVSYRKGISMGKKALIEHSGMDRFWARIAECRNSAREHRRAEKNAMLQTLETVLSEQLASHQRRHDRLECARLKSMTHFEQQLATLASDFTEKLSRLR